MELSVVVPVRDEEATVEALLRSLAAQTRPPDEVVIVDAGSRDGTRDRVRSFPARFPLITVEAGPLFPGQARNEGVRHATHPWLAFTDAGIELDPRWLEELAGMAAAPGVQVVFGTYEPVCDTSFRRAAALAYVPAVGERGVRGPSVASMAIRREVFEAVGGFPPYRAAEDLVFLERLLGGSFRVAFAPGALVRWQIAPTAATTFRRFALYSEHNLRAGRGRFWHLGVARQYVAVALLVTAAAAVGAGAWASLLVPAWMLARAGRSAWAKRRSYSFPTLRPGRIVGTAALLTLIDAATFVGALRWARSARRASA